MSDKSAHRSQEGISKGMTDLERARAQITEVDKEMADLFVKRMEAVRTVAAYKKERGLPILDEEQEKRVINRNSAYVEDLDLRNYYVHFIQDVMSVSRSYQHRLVEGIRVAYSGVEGAFAHIAGRRIFPTGQMIAYSCFEDAYHAVERGECDCAVLPIANSYAGDVGTVMDLMFNGDLFVNGVYDLHISQNLLGIEGAKLEDIKLAISHPQALEQCETFLKQNNIATKSAVNTAMSAQHVAELKDIHTAAIASKETAELYGLKIIAESINGSEFNTTRFAVFSNTEKKQSENHEPGTFLMMFAVRDEAGTLAKAINVISDFGFNMTALRSRPMKAMPWQYYFYVEVQGDAESEKGLLMREELMNHCVKLKVVGNYEGGEKELKDGETL